MNQFNHFWGEKGASVASLRNIRMEESLWYLCFISLYNISVYMYTEVETRKDAKAHSLFESRMFLYSASTGSASCLLRARESINHRTGINVCVKRTSLHDGTEEWYFRHWHSSFWDCIEVFLIFLLWITSNFSSFSDHTNELFSNFTWVKRVI